MLSVVAALLVIFSISVCSGSCPYELQGTPITGQDTLVPSVVQYNNALRRLEYQVESVFDDIYALIDESQECWPADEFNGVSKYTGFFVRLAWHCSGTYRTNDGAGGCTGGRQRYEPEASWRDNTNLDKARALLGPIKDKYGDALSWGDLFIFAGTAGILSGGGPITEICAGRIDEMDGTASAVLSDYDECPTPGNCSLPLGTTDIGLIYVNAQGYMGKPDPVESAPNIRDIFGRMGMNVTETVALIGGGHAFGKSHGACPAGAGPNPSEQPMDPWPGLCGTDFPEDVVTSGMEGQWTTNPFVWDNEFFTQLVNDEYTLEVGPGGKYQWKNERNGNMMFTTDYALVNDDSYLEIVKDFADDISLLNDAFSHAWAKLTTSGGYWAENMFCFDPDTFDIIEARDVFDFERVMDVVANIPWRE